MITTGTRVVFLDDEAHEKFPDLYPAEGTIGVVSMVAYHERLNQSILVIVMWDGMSGERICVPEQIERAV